MMNSFQKSFTLETRKSESARILEKYSDKLPVIVNRGSKTNIQDINKKKFLVPTDLTVAQFSTVIRKRIKLDESQAMFLFIKSENKDILPVQSSSMGIIYDQYKNEDGFLYITYAGENVFG